MSQYFNPLMSPRFTFNVFDDLKLSKNLEITGSHTSKQDHSDANDTLIPPSPIADDLLYDCLYQRLFRLFLLFSADCNGSQQDCLEQPTNVLNKNGRLLSVISTEQAKYLVNQMGELLQGLHKDAETQPCNHAPQQNVYKLPEENMTFREIVDCCRTLFPLRKHLESVVDSLFERYIQQVVRKGFLMCRKVRRSSSNKCGCFASPKSPDKKVCRAGRWRSYWCMILPGNICLWPLNKAEKASKKDRKRVVVDHNTQVEMGAFDRDRYVWEVRTQKHSFQFAHFDELQRQLWISDMEIIVKNCRRFELANFDVQNSKNSKLHMEQRQSWLRARSSSSRVLLESENKRLVSQLDSERKALYDEEIVRQLATRMLDEEAERSNNFQRTIQFLSEELEYERSHRLFLEKRLYEAVEIAEQSAMHEPVGFEDSGVGMEHVKRPPLDYLIISTQSV